VEHTPTHLDLFSGIGGFALAAQWAGFQTVAFCEIDKYCQKILAKNFLPQPDAFGCNGRSNDQRQGSTERARPSIISNIFDFDGTVYRGCDLITGGFPCQPFSVAGKRRGAADDRAIWPEMLRVIKEARPAWVLGENVPGIIPMELDNVLSDLEGIGYATRPFVIPACAVNARHRRDRLWIVGRNVSNDETERLERQCPPRNAEPNLDGSPEISMRVSSYGRTWLPEPDVDRVAHGIPSRVDRLKGLGNAIVPQVAYEILREIRNLI
jgi:DNA (cytosine-5)-methyltransferase 1